MGLILKFFPALEPYKIAIELCLLAGLFLSGLVTGWHFKGNEDASATLATQKQEVKQGNQANAQDAAHAQQHQARRDAQQQHDTRIAEQAAVAAAQPDYHTCQLKQDDLQLLNDAITGGANVPAN